MPTAVLVTEPFAAVARASAAARGLADLPIVVFPAGVEEMGPTELATVFADRWPDIRDGLTRC